MIAPNRCPPGWVERSCEQRHSPRSAGTCSPFQGVNINGSSVDPGLVRTRLPELADRVVHLVVDPAVHQLAAHLQSAAYRIVQESLSNAAKHARPTRAEVRIAHAGEDFTVEVTDDSDNVAPASGEGSGLRGSASGPSSSAAPSK